MEVYTLHFDGSCGPKNPGGTAAYGYTLHRGAELVDSDKGVIGSGPQMSNNVGEFMGLFHGLQAFDRCKAVQQDKIATLLIRGDSQLVINIMSGKWKAHSDKLYYPVYVHASGTTRKLRASGNWIQFDWIPREANTECDLLSKAHLAA